MTKLVFTLWSYKIIKKIAGFEVTVRDLILHTIKGAVTGYDIQNILLQNYLQS